MYHPDLIAARQRQFEAATVQTFPTGFPQYSLDDARAWTAQIVQTQDPETGEVRRALTREEIAFVKMAQLRVTYDVPWFLETFVWIDEEGHGVRPLYPLWESQRFVLARLAALELKHHRTRHPDGLFLNVLKARQLGVSTLAEALVAHRVLTQPYVRAIAGSDVEEQAKYLFRMVERIYSHLPWFLTPGRVVPYNAGRELNLSNGSSLKTAWGKTTRGALQETGGHKGNIERGRSQPLEEPILTPYGWKPMGAIAVGDRVIGSSGSSTVVLGVYLQGIEDVYRVTFSDGAWTECSGDHLWHVTTAYKTWAGLRPFVRTTLDLLEGGLYWNKPSGRMAKWFIPVTGPVQFNVNNPHIIPAYTMGVYLGDGSTRAGGLQISARDAEIKARVAAELHPDLRIGREYNHSWYLRKDGARRFHPYMEALKALGLYRLGSADKFIPPRYLYAASVEDRIALLQGLMDTDGTASRAEGRITFSTTSVRLAQDMRTLVEGLGGIARMSSHPPKKAHTRRNGQRIEGRHPYHVLSLCLPPGIVAFHLPRKIAQLTPLDERKYFPKRAIVAIERIGQKATQCLKVAAPDQLYLTRHCVVTHNTNSVVHISELATWDYPEQLDGSLMPGVPVNPDSLVIFESTAESAGDWWHRHWLACEEGVSPRDFENLFIPWCVEPAKYSLPPPDDWTPSDETQRVARTIERDSAQWIGSPLTLSRPQLYWYETTRAYYTRKHQLHQLFKEFPSNPHECFQYAGRSIFTWDELERIDQQAKKVIDVWAVEPSREIAELRQMRPDDPPPDRRPPAPRTTRITPREATGQPVPPGYGFRRLPAPELAELPSLRHSVLAIIEYPRVRGERKYVLGVDVGDGLGQDYSVISVIRQPTMDEPAEEVAQYVSNTVRPSHLAFVCDAIGRYYVDGEGLEALAAIELNNHGATVQDLLQLHLGYSNFYVWEVVDAADPKARYTRRIGWATTSRTRPILLEKFHDAVTTLDPLTQLPDFRLHSPITRGELRHFVTQGLLGEAEHAAGQHDDAIFASAIGFYVAHRLAGGEQEPIAERRRRRQELRMVAAQQGRVRDWRNTAVTADEADDARDPDETELDAYGDDLYFHGRSTE